MEEVWRSAKWTETRSTFEHQNVARLFLEREDTQAPHEESVKGHDTLGNVPFSLNSSLDPIPVSRDARLSGPEWDLLTAPCWAHEEGPARRRSEASSRPRAPSPRVISCPTCGTGQMRNNSELFV